MPSASTSPITHLQRAFAWNLGKIVPSEKESSALAASGVTDLTVQKYAAWRRSLLLVAVIPVTLTIILAVIDTLDSGIGDLTRLGLGLELAWLASTGALGAACLAGILTWKRPGRAATLLSAAWATTFLLPFVSSLLPVNSLYRVQDVDAAHANKSGSTVSHHEPGESETPAEEESEKSVVAEIINPAKLEKIIAMEELAIEFVLSGSACLLLLPAVLSLIPGAVNGCLRVKSLLPAAQLPGWLLVCAAPAFLLFWTVILVVANHAARSPLLVFGVLLWAGAPIWYSLRGEVFVRSQIGEAEAGRIADVKRMTGITALMGIGLLLTFLLTTKVVGLQIIGFDASKAVTTKIEELTESDNEVGIEDVQTALADSKSLVYALDLSSWQFVVDFLAKLLIVTAVFADLVLRATLWAWRNDRELRAGPGAAPFDATAAAAVSVFESPAVSTAAS